MKRIIVRRHFFSCYSVPVVRRQYGVAARTPKTVAIYRPARLSALPVPSNLDWVRYYAGAGTDWEFLAALFYWLSHREP